MKNKLLPEFALSHRTASIQGSPSVELDGFSLGHDEAKLSDASFLEADDDEIEGLLPIWHLSKV